MKQVLTNQEGAAAVEAAFVTFPLFLLTLALIELMMVLTVEVGLETSVLGAVRAGYYDATATEEELTNAAKDSIIWFARSCVQANREVDETVELPGDALAYRYTVSCSWGLMGDFLDNVLPGGLHLTASAIGPVPPPL